MEWPMKKPEAFIFDMDGTLENYNSRPITKGMELLHSQHELGRVIIILTARDHEFAYHYTHDWVSRELGQYAIPFVGPFLRNLEDQRYACDFKLDVYQRLSGLYEIVGAADDDNYVLDMWHRVKKDRPDFEVHRLEYEEWVKPDEDSIWWDKHGFKDIEDYVEDSIFNVSKED